VTSRSALRVALVPQAPPIVPEPAAGGTAPVRAACLAAVTALTQVTARWVAVGTAAAEPSAEVVTEPRHCDAPHGVGYHVAVRDVVRDLR
jgi:hypothetical protein